MEPDPSVLVPSADFEIDFEVKRSRFIGRAEPVSDPKEARDLVAERKRLHPDASHVAYAFVTGKAASETAGMSDDGEPKGTAGRPIMEVVKGRGIRNVLVTVTRYFGGTKLGTGGLVQAYGEAAKRVLDGVPLKELVPSGAFRIEIPYVLYDRVKKVLDEAQAAVGNETFGELVLIECEIPDRAVEDCRARLGDLSSGRIEMRSAD